MGQNEKYNDQQIEHMGKMAGLLLVGVLFIFTAPVLILSGVASYVVWASFREREERKWIRTTVIIGAGFFITNGAWLTFQYYVPVILGDLFSQRKIASVLNTTLVQNAVWAYFPILAGGFYLFENRFKANMSAYRSARELVIKWFFPFRFVTYITESLVQIVANAFGVAVTKTGDVAEIIFSLIVLLLASQIIFALGFSITQKTPYLSLVTGALSAYVLLFWYYLFSNKWRAENKSNNAILLSKNNKGIHIGRLLEPKRMDLNLTWKDVNHHIHILGQPGAGKSVLLRNIYAHQIMNGQGMLMLDLKADVSVRSDFLSLAELSGRLNDLIIIDLSHPEESFGYNPLLFGNATEIKDKIIGSIVWSEPHYKRACEMALLIVLKGLVWVRDQKQLTPTLEDVLTAISSVSGVTALSELVEDLEIKNDLYGFVTDLNKSSLKNLEGLRAELTLLVKSEFGSIFKNLNALIILEAIQSNKVILVNLDGQTYSESAKKFGRMLLGDLRAASGAIVTNLKAEERPKFTIIVDEFSDIVSTEEMAESFVGFLNRCRGSGLGVVIAHQSLGDFKDDKVKSQIMDSTETMFSFVQKDPDTCERLASIVGTEAQMKFTEQTSENILFNAKTGMGTQREVQEYIYHPNVFKNLNTGEAVYVAKKPTRHGIVQVAMIEIEHQNVNYPVSELTNDQTQLSLNTRLLSQKKEFAESFKQEDVSPTLEI